jgi:hypothetical protein
MKEQQIAKEQSCKKDGVKSETRYQQFSDLGESLQNVDPDIPDQFVFSVLVFLNQTHSSQLVKMVICNAGARKS